MILHICINNNSLIIKLFNKIEKFIGVYNFFEGVKRLDRLN